MIARLRGTLIERRGNVVTVDCHGVGYLVTVTIHTLLALPAAGELVTLRIYTHTSGQDGKVTLFGFGSAAERELFDLLITVKNVGPGLAISILSGGAGTTEIAQLIAGEQVAALTKLKGVGKKTAEMLVVELHDKCTALLLTWGASGEITGAAPLPASPRNARPQILDDVANALTQLGWRAGEADKVVAELSVGEGATIESLLREALRSMPR